VAARVVRRTVARAKEGTARIRLILGLLDHAVVIGVPFPDLVVEAEADRVGRLRLEQLPTLAIDLEVPAVDAVLATVGAIRVLAEIVAGARDSVGVGAGVIDEAKP